MGKHSERGYKPMSIYWDVSDPLQRECYDILQKAPRKKGRLLGIMAHYFLEQFKDPESLTEKDIMAYVNYYDIAGKMNNPTLAIAMPQFIAPNETPTHSPPQKISENSAEPPKRPATTVTRDAPKPVAQQKVEPESAGESTETHDLDMDSVFQAMNAFSLN